MLTLVQGYAPKIVQVASSDGDVRVKVKTDVQGVPDTTLTRQDVHQALVRAKAKAEDFIAAVEGDIEATAA